MADRVYLLPHEVYGEYLVPSRMVEDLLAIAQLRPEEIDRVSAALGAAKGFLDGGGLLKIVRDVIPDREVSSAISIAIRSLRPKQLEFTLASLREWREVNKENAQRVPEEMMEAIERNLTHLVRDYPAWDRRRKARRLATLTGNQVGQIDLICDVRPVFDHDRERIEGFIPLTTLKLSYEGQGERNGCIEVLLSVDDLDDLSEKVEMARKKVDALRESIDRWLPGRFVQPFDQADVEGEDRP